MSDIQRPGSFRDALMKQAKDAIEQKNQLNQQTPIHSYQQQKKMLSQELYDTSQALSYAQGVDHIKTILKKDLADTLDEALRERQSGVIVKKDKTYFKNRLQTFKEKIEEIIQSDQMRFYDVTHDEFIKLSASEIVGWDVLDDAFADPEISDIFVYQWNKVYVEKAGVNVYYPRAFRNEKHYQDFVARLVYESGTKFDKGSNKISDFELYGDRFCAVNQAIAPNGSSLTIRKHAESHVRLSQMIASNCMDENMAELFRLMFKGQCNIIYAGITGSGKTTALRALVDEYVTHLNRRVLTCEDTPELFLENDQTLELVTFKSNNAKDSIGLDRLVTTALRLKPKYILVGEVRSVEAEAAVEAAATGHSTSFTMHAEKPIDTINRLVTNYQKAMPSLGSDVVERIIGAAIDVVAIQKNIPGIGRRVVSITEVGYNYDIGRVSLTPIMQYDYKTNTFKALNPFSSDMMERMLGAGVKWDEMDDWLNQNQTAFELAKQERGN